jgi:hypothetical protein
MPTIARCPHCGQKHQLPESKVGKPIVCRRCQKNFTVGDTSVPPPRVGESPFDRDDFQNALTPEAAPQPGQSIAPDPGQLDFGADNVPQHYSHHSRWRWSLGIWFWLVIVVLLLAVAAGVQALIGARPNINIFKEFGQAPLGFLLGVGLLLVTLAFYFMPTVIVLWRDHPQRRAIFAVNLLAVFTFLSVTFGASRSLPPPLDIPPAFLLFGVQKQLTVDILSACPFLGWGAAMVWALTAVDRSKQRRGDYAN